MCSILLMSHVMKCFMSSGTPRGKDTVQPIVDSQCVAVLACLEDILHCVLHKMASVECYMCTSCMLGFEVWFAGMKSGDV